MELWTALTQAQAVLVTGMVGAGGAVLAALLANIVGQMLGSRQSGRQHWSEVRHLAFAEVTQRFHAVWDAYDDAGVVDLPPGEADHRAQELLAAYARASLLVRRRETAHALERLHEVAQYLWARDDRDWSRVDTDCARAAAEFRRAARRELGMPDVDR